MTAFGQIRGQIRIDAAQALAQYAALRTANAATVSNLRAASSTLIGVGIASVAAGAGLLAMFGKAVTAAANFQKKIDFFGAVTDATQADMQAVADKALEMGKTTIFSAGQMADAFVEFGKAGVSTKDILGGVADAVVALASAADINLTQASDIIISTMQTFKLGAAATGHIADLLAGAANSSIVDVTDLGVSLKYVGGIAAATGVPLESVVTALSLLGQAGIKGSTAGTSLRQILVSLNATSGKAQKTLKDLGIITKDNTNLFIDAQGHLKPLDQIFQILKTHTENLTDAQRLSALKIIFNNRALAAANILLKDGAQGFDQMAGAINKVTATDVAHKRLDNLAGDWLRLKNTIQTMLIQAGTPFQNFMRNLIQFLTSAVKWFGNLNPHIQTAIFAFIGIVGVLLVLLGSLLLIIGVVTRVIFVFKTLRAALILVRSAALITSETFVAMWVALFGPFALIAAIVLAVVAILVILYLKVKVVRDIINAAGRAIVTAFKAVVDFFRGLPSFFSNIWSSIVGGVTTAWNAITGAIKTAVNAVRDAIQSVWEGIQTIIVRPIEAAANGIVSAWDTIVNAFAGPIKAIINFVGRNWRALVLIFGIFGAVVDIITAHWKVIVGIFQSAVNLILLPVRFLFNTLVTFITVQVNAIVSVVRAVWGVLVTVATVIWTAVSTAVMAVVNALVTVFRVQFNVMKTIVTTIWNAQLAVTRAVWAVIMAVVRTAVNTVLTIVRGIVVIATVVGNAFRAAYNAIASVVSTILGFMRGFIGRILGAIGNVTGPMARVGTNIIRAIYNAIVDAAFIIYNFFRGFLGNILRNIGDAGSWLFDVGRAIIQGMINGIQSLAGAAVDAVKNVGKSVINGAKSLFGIHSPSTIFHTMGQQVVQGLANGINQNKHLVQSALDSLDSLVNSHNSAFNATFGARATIGNGINSGSSNASNSVAIDNLTKAVGVLAAAAMQQNETPTKANLYLDPLGTQLLATVLQDSNTKTQARRGV